MLRVKAAKIPLNQISKREMYALLCYYYPRYSLQDAQRMPDRDLRLLVKTAKKQEAMKMYNLTQIAAAPHSAKGRGVKKLLDHFKKVVDS